MRLGGIGTKVIRLLLCLILVMTVSVIINEKVYAYTPQSQGAYTFGVDKFQPDYAVGYIYITNSSWQNFRTESNYCSAFPGRLQIVVENWYRAGKYCIDHYNSAVYNGEYYDIREYVWIQDGESDDGNAIIWVGDGGCGARGGSGDFSLIRELHFYKSGTLQQSNPQEVEFKGIMQLIDCDTDEGWTINNVNKAYLSQNTYVVKTDTNTWKGTYEPDYEPDSYRKNIWIEAYGNPQRPLTIIYWPNPEHYSGINFEGSSVSGKITYDPNGGSGSRVDQIVAYGYQTQIKGQIYNRDGFIFTGWNTDPNGYGTQYNPDGWYTFNSQVTLYAQWKQLYQVTYYPNGGNGNPYQQAKFNSGDWIQLSQNLFWRDGYRFKGWNTDPNGWGTGYSEYQWTQFWGNVNLYAQWEQLYRITYDPNGASGQAYTSGYFQAGSWMTIDQNRFQRPGYRFMGWNTDRNRNGTSYSPGGSYQFWNNITLYAQWEPLYKLTVNPNGGVYTDRSTGQQFSYSSIWELIQNEKKQINDSNRAGYSFRGYEFN